MSNSAEYEPMLDLPSILLAKESRAWSPSESATALEWTIRRLDVIPRLLGWLGVDPGLPCPDLLRAAGVEAVPILRSPAFSTPGPNRRTSAVAGRVVETDIGPILTASGEAVALDLGLLLASCLQKSWPELVWTISRGPSTFVSRNRPVLESGPIGSGFDPALIGLNAARRSVRTGDSTVWAEIFASWEAQLGRDR